MMTSLLCDVSTGQVTVNIRVASVRLFNPIKIENELGSSSSVDQSPDWISLDELDRQLESLSSRKAAEAVRRGQVTRRRRPVQLVPDSSVNTRLGAMRSALSTVKPELLDVVSKKPQFFGRLVTWMTSGWQRGRSSRSLLAAEAGYGLQSDTGDRGLNKRRQIAPISGDRAVDAFDHRLAASDVNQSNANSSASGNFHLRRDDVIRPPVPSSQASAPKAGDDVTRPVRQRHHQSIDNLRRAADCVRVASQEFYSALTGNTMFGDVSQSRDRLLRFAHVHTHELAITQVCPFIYVRKFFFFFFF